MDPDLDLDLGVFTDDFVQAWDPMGREFEDTLGYLLQPRIPGDEDTDSGGAVSDDTDAGDNDTDDTDGEHAAPAPVAPASVAPAPVAPAPVAPAPVAPAPVAPASVAPASVAPAPAPAAPLLVAGAGRGATVRPPEVDSQPVSEAPAPSPATHRPPAKAKSPSAAAAKRAPSLPVSQAAAAPLASPRDAPTRVVLDPAHVGLPAALMSTQVAASYDKTQAHYQDVHCAYLHMLLAASAPAHAKALEEALDRFDAFAAAPADPGHYKFPCPTCRTLKHVTDPKVARGDPETEICKDCSRRMTTLRTKLAADPSAKLSMKDRLLRPLLQGARPKQGSGGKRRVCVATVNAAMAPPGAKRPRTIGSDGTKVIKKGGVRAGAGGEASHKGPRTQDKSVQPMGVKGRHPEPAGGTWCGVRAVRIIGGRPVQQFRLEDPLAEDEFSVSVLPPGLYELQMVINPTPGDTQCVGMGMLARTADPTPASSVEARGAAAPAEGKSTVAGADAADAAGAGSVPDETTSDASVGTVELPPCTYARLALANKEELQQPDYRWQLGKEVPLSHLVDNVCMSLSRGRVPIVARFQRVQVRAGAVMVAVALHSSLRRFRKLKHEGMLGSQRRLYCVRGARVSVAKPRAAAAAAAAVPTRATGDTTPETNADDGSWVMVDPPESPTGSDAPEVTSALARLALS